MPKDILIVEDRREDQTGIEEAVSSVVPLLPAPVHVHACRSQASAIARIKELSAVRQRNADGLRVIVADLQIFPDDQHTANDDAHERQGLSLLKRLTAARAAPGDLFHNWADPDLSDPFLICCTAMGRPETIAEAEASCDVLISKNDPDWKLHLARELEQHL